LAIRHDVTSKVDWKAAIAYAGEAFSGVSVLVNNAGIAQLGSVEDLSVEEWRRIMSVNADTSSSAVKMRCP
jgi:3(or 17)beta-hydroxysteroid dehydrogenase